MASRASYSPASMRFHTSRMSLSPARPFMPNSRLNRRSISSMLIFVLLAWPDCCFRAETVLHPRSRQPLLIQPPVFVDDQAAPKEAELLRICQQEKAQGRRVLAYSIYSGARDTTARLKALLEHQGLKVAVLRASVDAARREDWVADQVERGIDVLICNPELVKTSLEC